MMKKRHFIKKALSFAATFCVMSSLIAGSAVFAQPDSNPKATDELWEAFGSLAPELKSRPLWFWNDSLGRTTKEGIREIMVNSKEQSGYYGFGILPNWQDGYLTDRYFELYGYALETAKELGLKMCLYDENGFPSGSANDGNNGGLFERKYPEYTYKRLDKTEKDVEGPALASVAIPNGEYRTYLGAVAMNTDTKELIDISDKAIFIDESPDAVIGPCSSSNHSLDGYDASKAFDGNMTTRWNAADRAIQDEWLRINYTQPVEVDRIVIKEALGRITSYELQYLGAGNEWVSLDVGTTVGENKTFSFNKVSSRSFRLLIHDLNITGGASIYEFELYNGASKVPNPTGGENLVSRVEYNVPEGNWKVMVFAVVKDGSKLVDYLSEEAVDKFIDMTHQEYYNRFPEYFGTVIDSAFYDEPPLYHAGGRTWTGEFNKMFEETYGFDPILYYPSMWYDVGPDTAAMRNALFNFRAQLFAVNYIKNMDDWCTEHGIQLTGHMDQEEIANPVSICGDLMKVFKYQAIPGLDEIVAYDRGRVMYKVISSAAYNYDKPLVMTEIYGAMGEGMGIPTLYKDAMDEYAKGVNLFVPHAIWYNNLAGVGAPPELSYRSSRYGAELPIYNNFIARMSALMQKGRHVADIGVLYPINALAGGYRFGPENQYMGGVIAPEADYMNVGDILSTTIRRDFTFVHPEVMAENVSVEGNELRLNNEINFENYKVFIMPGSKTISYEALKRIKEFYDAGGKVIATTELPSKSSEFGHDNDVKAIIKDMFNVGDEATDDGIKYSASSSFNASYGAEQAFDGIASNFSRWNAGDRSFADPQWLEVDFGKTVTFNKTVVKENLPYRVSSYKIQYWDGAKWINASTGGGIGASATNTFDQVTATKVRLYIDPLASDSASIQEFEVYNDSKNIAMKETPMAYSASSFFMDNPAYAPEKAFDGVASDESRWNAGDQTFKDPQWLEVDFGKPVTVNKTVIHENYPARVTSFKIQYWNGMSWIDATTGADIYPNVTNTFPEITTRKLRLYVDPLKSDSVSIQEFEVYYNDSKNLAVQTASSGGGEFEVIENANGGQAIFLGKTYASTLEAALDTVLGVYDVKIDGGISTPGGHLSYIHKVNDGNDIYYFANSGDTAVNSYVNIRKQFEKPMIWDPHNGQRYEPASSEEFEEDGVVYTRIKLNIPAVHSIFIMDEKAAEGPGIDFTISSVSATPSLVEKCAASLKVTVAGENLGDKEVWAYIDVNGAKFALTQVVDGVATLSIPQSDSFVKGSYKIVAYVEGYEQYSASCDLQVAGASIWDVSFVESSDGLLKLMFNADVADGFKIKINGKAEVAQKISSREILLSNVKVDELGDTFDLSISGLKFKDYFQSYKFALNLKVNSSDIALYDAK